MPLALKIRIPDVPNGSSTPRSLTICFVRARQTLHSKLRLMSFLLRLRVTALDLVAVLLNERSAIRTLAVLAVLILKPNHHVYLIW